MPFTLRWSSWTTPNCAAGLSSSAIPCGVWPQPHPTKHGHSASIRPCPSPMPGDSAPRGCFCRSECPDTGTSHAWSCLFCRTVPQWWSRLRWTRPTWTFPAWNVCSAPRKPRPDASRIQSVKKSGCPVPSASPRSNSWPKSLRTGTNLTV